MSRKKKTDEFQEEAQSHLTIIEAVENLSSIAEMDGNDRIGVIEDHVIVHDRDDEGAPTRGHSLARREEPAPN